MAIQQLVLASNNHGKINEFTNAFANIGICIIPQTQLGIAEIEEPFTTFVENALHKARHCSMIAKLPALADDSGICVEALQGLPGVNSAYYAGKPKNDTNNNTKLIQEIKQFSNKRAYFYCTLILVRSHCDPQPIIADGSIEGVIVETPKGSSGFGYDPHFYLPQLDKTMAELSIAIKNQISHRSIATKKLISKCKKYQIFQ